ncbi:MAG: glycosyltransferase family 4 protein [Treponema sp.]|nr:glycosyltransferase family 4 protein [Treponema sp.]
MRVGIFIPDMKPDMGGASSLSSTIREEILLSEDIKDVEFILLYCGGLFRCYETVVGGYRYLNISRISVFQKVAMFSMRIIFGFMIPDKRLNRIGKKESIDLFWLPTPVLFDMKYPYIYTVWDLGHRQTPWFPEVSRSGWLWEDRERMYQSMLYKASFVITGNEEGKKEILENYPIPPSKVRISRFPVTSFCRGEEERPDFLKDSPFFFYPAQFWPHKNHIVILDAVECLSGRYGEKVCVYLTGSDKGNRCYIEDEIKKRNLGEQVKITGFVSDKELKYLYTHAVAMIFASLMGPNNMPPIEATYLRCPVIITDLDGHKEQLGDTALYFNGYRPEELAEHMHRLMADPVFRETVISKEAELARQFDNINYFSEIKKIIREFSLIRRIWGSDYVHPR